MKKLSKQEFYQQLEMIEKITKIRHEDFEIQALLSDLWFTLAEMTISQFLIVWWRTKKVEAANNLHVKCCGLDKL